MIVEKTAMIGKGAAMVVVWPCLSTSKLLPVVRSVRSYPVGLETL